MLMNLIAVCDWVIKPGVSRNVACGFLVAAI